MRKTEKVTDIPPATMKEDTIDGVTYVYWVCEANGVTSTGHSESDARASWHMFNSWRLKNGEVK